MDAGPKVVAAIDRRGDLRLGGVTDGQHVALDLLVAIAVVGFVTARAVEFGEWWVRRGR